MLWNTVEKNVNPRKNIQTKYYKFSTYWWNVMTISNSNIKYYFFSLHSWCQMCQVTVSMLTCLYVILRVEAHHQWNSSYIDIMDIGKKERLLGQPKIPPAHKIPHVTSKPHLIIIQHTRMICRSNRSTFINRVNVVLISLAMVPKLWTLNFYP